jgi:hypothetical protein
MLERLEGFGADVLAYRASGKLTGEDLKALLPEADREIAEHGRARILLHLHDFEGWGLEGLFDDLAFHATRGAWIERIAVVGERAWEGWLAALGKPLARAKLAYFDASQFDAARAWINEK